VPHGTRNDKEIDCVLSSFVADPRGPIGGGPQQDIPSICALVPHNDSLHLVMIG